MFTKTTGISTSATYSEYKTAFSIIQKCFLPGHSLILPAAAERDVLVDVGYDEIGARAHNNFSDEYSETFTSKHC